MTSSHGSSTAGYPAQLPARALQLLDELEAIVRNQLEALLSMAFTEAEQQLFRHAERAPSNEQQTLLDSQRLLRQRRDDLIAATLQSVLASRTDFGQPPPPRHARATRGLELLDPQAQEENTIVDDLAARLESRASTVLFELGHRYAVLGARPVMDAAAQPFGPHALCRALQDAIDGLDIPSAHRIEIYRAFERLATARIVPLYESLNQRFVERGVLPHLRAFAPRRRRGSETASSASGNDGENVGSETEAATPSIDDNAGMPPPPMEGPGSDARAADVLAALTELLAQRRRQLGPGIMHGASHTPSDDDLQKVLSTLQTHASEIRQSDGTTGPRTMRQLRQEMMAQLRQVSPDASAPRLAPQQVDTVELMSMLFDRLVEDVQSDTASLLLSQSQAPLLRVALADKGFFTRHDHPARRWLDTLAEVSARWGGDGEDADATLIEHMQAMTRRINREFDGDVSLFETLSEDLQKQAETLARKAEVAERRHVEASKGRERLELARLRADELVGARLHLRYESTPTLIRSLLQHAWTDVLALTLLREGEDSDNFRHELAIADALTRAPNQPLDTPDTALQLREDIERGLARVGMPEADAELLAREAVGDPELDADGAPVTRTELAMKLKQRKRLGSAGDEEVAEFAPPSLNDEEQRALAELKSMPFGTWFDCDGDEPGSVTHRKMAWYSPHTGRCLLVNRRGARCDINTLEQLAREIAAGRARVPPPRKGSMIDRALESILGKLRSLIHPGEADGGTTP